MAKLSLKRVAVLVETSNVYGREIQLGIADFVRSHAKWSMFVEQHELGALPPPWLLRQTWDGIISRPTTKGLSKVFARLGVPVVDLNDQHLDLGYPQLRSDNDQIGRMAAKYMRERGFVHFGYCGFRGEPWAAERREGFAAALAEYNCTTSLHETFWRGRNILSWDDEQRGLETWLRSLPKPVAVFACNDVRGRHVLEVCRRCDIHVPQQIAVLGVDNDELLCRMSDPPLSSVVPDAYRIGFRAAELLQQLMTKKTTRQAVQRIAPRDVVTRQSTDVWAVNDPVIADAVRFIHENACSGIRVDDVLRAVPISRSLLERGFRRSLGRSPHVEIRQVQLRETARLLTQTDLPLKQIAARCGIAYLEYLSYLFKKMFGEAPGAYRRRYARQSRSS